jgi:hypothetical protein
VDAGSKVVKSSDGSVRVWDAVGGVWLGPFSAREAEAKAKSLRARVSEQRIIAQSKRDAQMGLFSTAAPAPAPVGEYEVRGFSDGWRVYSPRMGAFIVSPSGEPWRTEREAIAAMVDLRRSEATGPRDAAAQLGLFSRGNGAARGRRPVKSAKAADTRPKARRGR